MHVYAQMYQIVATSDDLCQRYRSDLIKHDRRTIEAAAVGEEFIWCPYRDGSHLVSLSLTPSTTQNVVETILQGFPGVRTYHVSILFADGVGTVRKVTRERAIKLAACRFTQQIQRLTGRGREPERATA